MRPAKKRRRRQFGCTQRGVNVRILPQHRHQAERPCRCSVSRSTRQRDRDPLYWRMGYRRCIGYSRYRVMVSLRPFPLPVPRYRVTQDREVRLPRACAGPASRRPLAHVRDPQSGRTTSGPKRDRESDPNGRRVSVATVASRCGLWIADLGQSVGRRATAVALIRIVQLA